ncbi:hypothetical protein [Nonomuraea phyllanthi]|uniref:hypothetical protein n=1 Tax=Nonomuraea phyllanthi TaxID=2219224 RepID=UPI00186AEC64|nr:hypothetical protein [Nonomuraea phyllanthi]
MVFVAARWLLYLLALYYFFRSARLLVWHLFGDAAPSDVQDPTVTRIKRLRTWTAPTVSLVLLASFAPEDVLQEKVSEPLFTLIVAPWLLVATATVVIGILIRCAPPEQRPAMRTALRKPLRKLGYYAGTLLLPYGLLIGFVLWGPEGGVDLNDAGWPIQAAVAAFVWLALVFLFASARVVRTGFGLDTVHPALPALLTGILVWECFALNGMPGGPPAVACLLFLGGPIMVSAIVWWELHRLRVSHGVTLRGGRPAGSVRDQFAGERVGGGDSDLIRSAAHMYHAAERRDVRGG